MDNYGGEESRLGNDVCDNTQISWSGIYLISWYNLRQAKAAVAGGEKALVALQKAPGGVAGSPLQCTGPREALAVC